MNEEKSLLYMQTMRDAKMNLIHKHVGRLHGLVLCNAVPQKVNDAIAVLYELAICDLFDIESPEKLEEMYHV